MKRQDVAAVIQLVLEKKRIMGDDEWRQIASLFLRSWCNNQNSAKQMPVFIMQHKQQLACHSGGFHGNQKVQQSLAFQSIKDGFAPAVPQHYEESYT